MSKTKTFSVPLEQICEFAAIIEEYDICNSIVESDVDAVIVEVTYEKDDREAIFAMMELLDQDDL